MLLFHSHCWLVQCHNEVTCNLFTSTVAVLPPPMSQWHAEVICNSSLPTFLTFCVLPPQGADDCNEVVCNLSANLLDSGICRRPVLGCWPTSHQDGHESILSSFFLLLFSFCQAHIETMLCLQAALVPSHPFAPFFGLFICFQAV